MSLANELHYFAKHPWSDQKLGAPFQDFAAAQLLYRGKADSGSAGAVAIMSRATFRCVQHNMNPEDLYGRRTTACFSPHGHGYQAVKQLMLGDDLPEPFLDNEFNYAVPDGLVHVYAQTLESIRQHKSLRPTAENFRTSNFMFLVMHVG